jgi:hypothetical protein
LFTAKKEKGREEGRKGRVKGGRMDGHVFITAQENAFVPVPLFCVTITSRERRMPLEFCFDKVYNNDYMQKGDV